MPEISIKLKDTEGLRKEITKLLLANALLKKDIEIMATELRIRHDIMIASPDGLDQYAALCSALEESIK